MVDDGPAVQEGGGEVFLTFRACCAVDEHGQDHPGEPSPGAEITVLPGHRFLLHPACGLSLAGAIREPWSAPAGRHLRSAPYCTLC